MNTVTLLKTDPRRRDAFVELKTLIDDAALAVQNSRPRETLEHYIEEIKRSYDQITQEKSR